MSLRPGTALTLALGLGFAAAATAQDPDLVQDRQAGEPVVTLPPEPSPLTLPPEPADEAASPVAAPAAQPDQGTEVVIAPDPGEAFVHANTAYDAGEYGRAARLYGDLVARGHDDGRLYYNLGNAFLRGGELGRAIAAYRRAQTRRPRDQDIAANLGFARNSAKDALEPPGPSPILQTLLFWHHGLSRAELLRLTLAANALFWALAAFGLFRRGSEVLRWAIGASLLLLLAVGGSLAWRTLSPLRVAVVVPQEIDAHAGTNPDSVVRFKLHAGSEVRLVERREDWLRIELPDGQQGWIERQHAEIVET